MNSPNSLQLLIPGGILKPAWLLSAPPCRAISSSQPLSLQQMPFQGLTLIDVGCGGGLLSEPLARMGAYASTIVAAEYILQWLPKGTHQWSSFLTPEELTMILHRASVDVKEMAGFVFNPITGRWLLSDDISVNFIAYGTKRNDLGDK